MNALWQINFIYLQRPEDKNVSYFIKIYGIFQVRIGIFINSYKEIKAKIKKRTFSDVKKVKKCNKISFIFSHKNSFMTKNQ
jgi:hypothetical protein